MEMVRKMIVSNGAIFRVMFPDVSGLAKSWPLMIVLTDNNADSTKIVIGNRFTNGDRGKKNGNLPSLHRFCSSLQARWKYGGGCGRVTDSGKLEWRGMKFTFYLIVLLVI